MNGFVPIVMLVYQRAIEVGKIAPAVLYQGGNGATVLVTCSED